MIFLASRTLARVLFHGAIMRSASACPLRPEDQANVTDASPTYRTGRAALAIVTAVLALSLGDAVIKATSLSLPLWQMFVLRSAMALPVLLWLARRRGPIAFGSIFWVLVRSVLLVLMWLSYYMALPLMPLSLAAATYYTAPILITAIAALLACRWPAPRALLAIALGFGGVILVLRPDTSGFQIATLLPLLAAFLYACAMVLTWAKCRDADPFALALALNVAFIIAGMILGLFSGRDGSFVFRPWQSLNVTLIGITVALAVATLIGSVGAAIAYQNGPPAMVAALDYSYLVFSLIWAVLFFAERPDFLSLAGIVVIAGAGILALPQREKAPKP
ncbi:MAG: DMT family transporter [Kiloniellales bacterium]|nr:DMT family transporter [Kiloniellales bacterium]